MLRGMLFEQVLFEPGARGMQLGAVQVLFEVLVTVQAHFVRLMGRVLQARFCEIDGRARGHAVWGAGAGPVVSYLGSMLVYFLALFAGVLVWVS